MGMLESASGAYTCLVIEAAPLSALMIASIILFVNRFFKVYDDKRLRKELFVKK